MPKLNVTGTSALPHVFFVTWKLRKSNGYIYCARSYWVE